MKRIFFVISFLFMLLNADSQVMTNPRQVLGTTGGTSGGSFPWGTVDYTVGEVMIQTFSSGTPFTIKTVTQGFQQPDNTLSVIQVSVNSTCIGANNGSIALTPVNATGPVTFTWTPSSIGDTNVASNLAPGIYQYTITDSVASVSGTVSIAEDAVNCTNVDGLTFYTGITPNGDGNNETWQIDSIVFFPENSVSIYNRWGDLVWSGKNYDNVNIVWDGKNKNGKPLPDATYFYLVEIPEKTYKGWVELTH